MNCQNKFSTVFETEDDCCNNPLMFIEEEQKDRSEFDIIWESPLMQK